MIQTTDLQLVNSLSYADVAGLQFGLPRLPGELTSVYVDRLYRAAVSKRDHSYEGMLDSLVLEFGLHQQVAGQLTSTLPSTSVLIGPGLITVNATTIPTAVVDGDTYLTWRTLGAVFADLEAVAGISMTLMADPALSAMQLVRQGNVFTVLNEPVLTLAHPCAHAGVIAESVRFNLPVSTWTLTNDVLTLAQTPPTGLLVSYQYQANPFDVVISEVGLFGLADPTLARVAVSEAHVLAYQVREFIQAVMQTDRSYWTK
jgi:hypothetical protein